MHAFSIKAAIRGLPDESTARLSRFVVRRSELASVSWTGASKLRLSGRRRLKSGKNWFCFVKQPPISRHITISVEALILHGRHLSGLPKVSVIPLIVEALLQKLDA
jgi:hypothetical protein